MGNNEAQRALLAYWAKQLSHACDSHGIYLGPPLNYSDNSERIRETLEKVQEAIAALEPLERVN